MHFINHIVTWTRAHSLELLTHFTSHDCLATKPPHSRLFCLFRVLVASRLRRATSHQSLHRRPTRADASATCAQRSHITACWFGKHHSWLPALNFSPVLAEVHALKLVSFLFCSRIGSCGEKWPSEWQSPFNKSSNSPRCCPDSWNSCKMTRSCYLKAVSCSHLYFIAQNCISMIFTAVLFIVCR